MGNKKIKKKLKKYVERDDFSRLKSCLHKHREDLDLNLLKFEGGNTLLHLVCQEGQDHAVWHLLKLGADPLLQNDKGQVPLHCACLFTLNDSHYGFYDLVEPLIDKCRRAQKVADNNGQTPRELVKQIRQLLADKGAKVEVDSDLDVDDQDQRDAESEAAWFDQLQQEVEAEYAESWGAYEQDFIDESDSYDDPSACGATTSRETYDAWSERMRREMHAKRRHAAQQANSTGTKRRRQAEEDQQQKHQEQEELRRKLEREHAEYQNRAQRQQQQKLIQSKAKYELGFSAMFKAEDEASSLGYSDIAWPTPSRWNKEGESLRDFLLCDMDTKDSAAIKKYLKGQQVKWHPDRFQQKLGGRLKTEDTERIMDKVKLISQLLNSIISEMDDS